jgi:DNA-binding transcriptional LysR family regulator
MVEEFMMANPEVSIELDFNDRRVNLIEGGFDLAIRITNRLEPGDVARKIGSCHGVIAAAPEYLARHGRPKHPDDLIEHQCFGYLLAPRLSWDFIIDGDVKSFPISGRLSANNGDALLASAILGLGNTYAPTFIAEQAIRERKLEILLSDFPSPELGIYAIFPSNRYVPHRVRAFVDYLSNCIGPKPKWDEILHLK